MPKPSSIRSSARSVEFRAVGSAARKGENEAWFRGLNERLEERAAVKLRSPETFELVCECAREECTERITVAFADYEDVRADPRHFIMIAAHRDPACERIFSTTGSYAVVEKTGEAARVAENEDPRS
jgi:hypothetical protein